MVLHKFQTSCYNDSPGMNTSYQNTCGCYVIFNFPKQKTKYLNKRLYQHTEVQDSTLNGSVVVHT